MDIIANKYQLLNQINKGSFGQIFRGKNSRTGEIVAIKRENKSETIKVLVSEAKIYQYLGKQDGFLQLKWFGTDEKYNYLVFDLLGYSLKDTMDTSKMSFITCLELGIQIIERIKVLHDHHLLHRDIKPDNFVFGQGENTNKLYLIDLGFCKRFNYNGKHIEETYNNKLIGSPNFVSLFIHKGCQASRRDDVISAIYVIAYMMLGKLDWFNSPNFETMVQEKENFNTNHMRFTFLKDMLHDCYNLSFDAKPDYEYLIYILSHVYKKVNL